MRQAQLPCYLTGPFQQNEHFFSREDVLGRLDSILLPSRDLLVSSEPQPFRYAALHGMAGLGKTEIAIEFMFKRKAYYRAIFWVRAESVTKLEADFANIAKELGLENPAERQNEVTSRELAKGWLSNPKETLDHELDTGGQTEVPWLLIFDNADNPAILNDYTHLFRSGSVLVTSRYPLPEARDEDRELSPKISIPLSPFSVDEASRFLRQLTPHSGQPDKSSLIVKRLGGHPLAISQMAGIIRQQFLSYTDFLERYDDAGEHINLHNMVLEPSRPTTRGTIYSIFAIQHLKANALLVLQIFSLLDPDEIPEVILTGLFQGSTNNRQPALTIGEFHAARGELLSRSLIGRNVEIRKLWIHRILQDTVRARMSHSRRQKIGAITISLLEGTWPEVPLDKKHKIDRWELCQSLYPHILGVETLNEAGIVRLETRPELKLASLLKEAGW